MLGIVCTSLKGHGLHLQFGSYIFGLFRCAMCGILRSSLGLEVTVIFQAESQHIYGFGARRMIVEDVFYTASFSSTRMLSTCNNNTCAIPEDVLLFMKMMLLYSQSWNHHASGPRLNSNLCSLRKRPVLSFGGLKLALNSIQSDFDYGARLLLLQNMVVCHLFIWGFIIALGSHMFFTRPVCQSLSWFKHTGSQCQSPA